MQSKKPIMLLGALGSVGQKVLKILLTEETPYKLVAISLSKDNEKNQAYFKEYGSKVKTCILQNRRFLKEYRRDFPEVNFIVGKRNIRKLIYLKQVKAVFNSISQSFGLIYSCWTLMAKKTLILANKESLVMAGSILTSLAKSKQTHIIPVDSEHNALFCLKNHFGKLDTIGITASGGAFFNQTRTELKSIDTKTALVHPTWQMGPKITIDSQTMVNKTFEIIEAMYLFNFPLNKIQVLRQSESKIHAFCSVNQRNYYFYSKNDMYFPIKNALLWPNDFKYFEISEILNCDVEEIPENRFLVYDALPKIFDKEFFGTTFSVLDDIAIAKFLKGTLSFKEIDEFILKNIDLKDFKKTFNIKNILKLSKKIQKKFLN